MRGGSIMGGSTGRIAGTFICSSIGEGSMRGGVSICGMAPILHITRMQALQVSASCCMQYLKVVGSMVNSRVG